MERNRKIVTHTSTLSEIFFCSDPKHCHHFVQPSFPGGRGRSNRDWVGLDAKQAWWISGGENVWTHWRGGRRKCLKKIQHCVGGIYKNPCMKSCTLHVFWLKTQFFAQKHKRDSCSNQNRTFQNRRAALMPLPCRSPTRPSGAFINVTCSGLVTFIFININPENPTDDTGTVVRGRVPSWALQAPFLWPVKATAWGDARSLICAARLLPERHFMRQRRA